MRKEVTGVKVTDFANKVIVFVPQEVQSLV